MVNFLNEKLSLGIFPTPIEFMKKMSEELGVNLFLKRDDLDEFLGSGNKVRKLEYLLREAKELGCDTILSAGGMQSNHCRATAYFSKRLGMDVELFLFGKSEFQGNLLIDKLLGAKVHPITHEEYSRVVEIMNNRAKELENRGHKAYVIPPGGSNATGLLGYASMVKELKSWEEKHSKIDYVVCATGTAGTIGGLELGKRIYEENFKVIGINVTKKSAEELKEKMKTLLSDFNSKYKTNFEMRIPEVVDGYVGEDYAVPSDEDFQVIEEVALKDHVIFDPVYTAKAFKGMKDLIKKGKISQNSNVLFIHTGGTFGLFAFAEQLKSHLEG
jgi:D-cysteine desulfhydrase family pyridoxal phosphate-dependent enzyme